MAKLQLILMRHGQTERYHSEGDRNRALTHHGKEQVQLVAESLRSQFGLPSHGISSNATRTLQTMEILKETWDPIINWQVEPNFYLADLRHIQEKVKTLSTEKCQYLILIGHNPGWSTTIQYLTGENVYLDTADAAVLSIENDSWEVSLSIEGGWRLEKIVESNLF